MRGHVAVISVRDIAALDALARPLPPTVAKAISFSTETGDRGGVWPASVPLVPVRRDE